MQSEEIDKKIQQAAEHHHPAYDEKAWNGMKKLLDKHLPQKKDDRRRFIFFLLLFLLLGSGAALLFIEKSGQPQKSILSKSNDTPVSSPVNSQAEKKTDDIKADKLPLPEQSTDNKQVDPVQSLTTDKPVRFSPRQYQDALQNTFTRKKAVISNTPSAPDKEDNTDKRASPVPVTNTSSVPGNINDNASSGNPPASAVKKATDEPKAITPDATAGITAVTKNEQKPPVTATAQQNDKAETPVINDIVKNKKTKPKKTSGFFVSVSASPDVSAAGGGEYGKMKLLAGAGLGYTFKNRLTLRTGFYSGRKIYSASPDAYNPPASFWANYPYLEKVEADCKVYEIPLSLSYSFGKSSKQNWFVSAGISSYLMKKESYNYFYKHYPNGPVYTRNWTIQDENKHLFSVLTFSGGYQRNISNRFFISAEPYVKIPLSGVGFGKVKLNSAGVQLTMGVKPFVKKSK